MPFPPPPEKNPESDNFCQFGECKQVRLLMVASGN